MASELEVISSLGRALEYYAEERSMDRFNGVAATVEVLAKRIGEDKVAAWATTDPTVWLVWAALKEVPHDRGAVPRPTKKVIEALPTIAPAYRLATTDWLERRVGVAIDWALATGFVLHTVRVDRKALGPVVRFLLTGTPPNPKELRGTRCLIQPSPGTILRLSNRGDLERAIAIFRRKEVHHDS